MSDNIFSSFYNRVLSFFQGDRNEGESAKDKATNRLKLVLMQDRSNLDGATMQKMREQLICVISKYIEIDQDALNLNLEAEGDEIALMLNIPVIRARTPEEIEELEHAEEEARKEEIRAAIEAEKSGDNQEDTQEDSQETENQEDNEEVKDSDNENSEKTEDNAENCESAEAFEADGDNEVNTEDSDKDDDSDSSSKSKKSKK